MTVILTTLMSFLNGLTSIDDLVKEFQAFAASLSAEQKAAFVSNLGVALGQLKSGQSVENDQLAAKGIADAISGM